MKKLFLSFVIVGMFSCNNGKNVPDVSKIKVDIQTQQFEKDFFALDTLNLSNSLQGLYQKYPGFLQDFIYNILALPAHPDSTLAVENGIRSFISTYHSLEDTANKAIGNIKDIERDIKRGLQFVKHYFPAYKLPTKIVTFLGPFNSYGNIITTDALGIGLQLYLGKSFSWYQTEAGQQLYPAYISRRFEPQYIPVNSIRTIIDDMYPNNSASRPLVEQMVETGKRLYLLDHLLPETPDTLKTGYTQQQLEGAYNNEAMIWAFFLQNDLLYAIDPALTKDYMNEAPNTAVLGEASPGFIGQFVGWQIVKKWMDKNEKATLEQLMNTDPKIIFEQSKYKPK
jgi:hypothetical protein